MSGLFSTLSATGTALDAQTAAINVASNNIANLNNSNYSDEVVEYVDGSTVQTADGPETFGLSVDVVQQVSAVLDQMVQQEDALTSGFTAEQSVYQQAQAALGESITNDATGATGNSSGSTTTDSGLEAAINAFFDAVQNYAADPGDQSEAAALVDQAGVLTDRFQMISSNLQEVQSGADSQVSSSITSANSLLQDVATLNSQIDSFEATDPDSAASLRDQREADLEQLSGLLPISVQENSQGEDLVTTTDTSGNSVTLVSDGTVANSLSYSAGVVSAGSTALGLSSGSIAGTITASTGAVQTLIDNLNALASQMVTAVNAAYNPTDATGGNFFDAAGTTAGTIALDPNLTDTTLTAGPNGAGDNSLALAVANVANQIFSTADSDAIDGTIGQFYANTVSGIGQALDTANTQVTDQTSVQNIVNSQRASVSGVSLNDEMTNLMSYQKAFQASSEVFQIVNEMLETVVTDLGVASS